MQAYFQHVSESYEHLMITESILIHDWTHAPVKCIGECVCVCVVSYLSPARLSSQWAPAAQTAFEVT